MRRPNTTADAMSVAITARRREEGSASVWVQSTSPARISRGSASHRTMQHQATRILGNSPL